MRVVKGRAHQIVHRRVDDNKGFCLATLHIKDRGNEDSGVARDQPSRLENQQTVERRKPCLDNLRVTLRMIAFRIVPQNIRDAEAAAEIDMIDGVTVGAQQRRQNRQSTRRRHRMARGR